MKSFCLLQKMSQKPAFNMNESFNRCMGLLGCHFCKNEFEAESKYEELLVLPLMASCKVEEDRFFRMFMCHALDDLGYKFSKEEMTDAEWNEHANRFNLCMRGNTTADDTAKALHSFLESLSESTYCHFMARLYWMAKYDLMFIIAINYFYSKVKFEGSGSRTKIYYSGRRDDFKLLDIGIALDEGLVEEITLEMMRVDNPGYDNDTYFFERKMLKKIAPLLNLEMKELLGLSFSHDGKTVVGKLFESLPNNELCLLYELLDLSDNQEWKSVNEVLKKWKNAL